MAERQQRGLADCSEAHLECKAMGYTMGTELYLRCRTMIAQRNAAQATTDVQAAAIVSQAVAPPLPPMTPLTSINCTSMAMGNMVNTHCQ
jgi:hypothetical protein